MAINGHFVKKMCGIFIGLVASFGDTSLPFLVPQLIYLNHVRIQAFIDRWFFSLSNLHLSRIFPVQPPFVADFPMKNHHFVGTMADFSCAPRHRHRSPGAPRARRAAHAVDVVLGGPCFRAWLLGLVSMSQKKIPSPDQMVRFMWKFPTKPWFRLGGCLVLGGWD